MHALSVFSIVIVSVLLIFSVVVHVNAIATVSFGVLFIVSVVITVLLAVKVNGPCFTVCRSAHEGQIIIFERFHCSLTNIVQLN